VVKITVKVNCRVRLELWLGGGDYVSGGGCCPRDLTVIHSARRRQLQCLNVILLLIHY